MNDGCAEGAAYDEYPANPEGGGPRCFVGVVGVLRFGVFGREGGGGTGDCFRIAVGGGPINRESDHGMSAPERPAAATYLAISR